MRALGKFVAIVLIFAVVSEGMGAVFSDQTVSLSRALVGGLIMATVFVAWDTLDARLQRKTEPRA